MLEPLSPFSAELVLKFQFETNLARPSLAEGSSSTIKIFCLLMSLLIKRLELNAVCLKC